MLIFLIGYMGSGKTTIGKIVAAMLNMCFVDMDAFIESRERKSVSQIFSETGEKKFRELERKCLLEVSDYKDVIVSTGGGAPCFFDNMDVMNTRGITIYINLTPKELAERLKTTNIQDRPILAGYQGDDLEEFIAENLAKREPFYSRAHIQVSGTDEEITHQIIRRLLPEI